MKKLDQSLRRFAAYSLLYLLGVTLCVSGFVLNRYSANASPLTRGADTGSGNSSIDITIWITIGVLTVAFAVFAGVFIVRRKNSGKG